MAQGASTGIWSLHLHMLVGFDAAGRVQACDPVWPSATPVHPQAARQHSLADDLCTGMCRGVVNCLLITVQLSMLVPPVSAAQL
jgi:hypothetical protein